MLRLATSLLLALFVPAMATAQGGLPSGVGAGPHYNYSSFPTCDANLATQSPTATSLVAADHDGTSATCNGNGNGSTPTLCHCVVGTGWVTDSPTGSGSGTSFDECAGNTSTCFEVKDDGRCGATADDGIWHQELQCSWNEDVLPALQAADTISIDWVWNIPDFAGEDVARLELQDTVRFCNHSQGSIGSAFPDCSTALESDIGPKLVKVRGETGGALRAICDIASRTEEPELTGIYHDVCMLFGDWSAAEQATQAHDQNVRWSFDQLRISDDKPANHPTCTTRRVGSIPMVFDSPTVWDRSSEIIVEGLNYGACQTFYTRENAPIMMNAPSGTLKISNDNGAYFAQGTPLIIYGRDRGLQIEGNLGIVPLASATYLDGYGAFSGGKWRGQAERPSIRIGGTSTLFNGSPASGTMNLFAWDHVEMGPNTTIQGCDHKPEIADITLGASISAGVDYGSLILRGFSTDNDKQWSQSCTWDGSLDPSVRINITAVALSTLSDPSKLPPFVIFDGTAEKHNEKQNNKALLSCSGLGAPELADNPDPSLAFTAARFTSNFLYQPCDGTGDADRCLGTEFWTDLYPNYVMNAGGGFSGPQYCAIRGDGGRWHRAAMFDNEVATVPPSPILASAASVTVEKFEANNGLGPMVLEDDAASFVEATLCPPGTCDDEPYSYVTIVSPAASLEHGGIGRLVDVPSSTQLHVARDLWVNRGTCLAGTRPGLECAQNKDCFGSNLCSCPGGDCATTTPVSITDGYKVQQALCWNPVKRDWGPDCSAATSLDVLPMEDYGWIHDLMVKVRADPPGGVDCRFFLTKNGDPIGNEAMGFTGFGTSWWERSYRPASFGATDLSKAGDVSMRGITDGFNRDDLIHLRVLDGPDGACAGQAIGAGSIDFYAMPQNVRPFGAVEGPNGDPSCVNGKDDDLDLLVDDEDPDCFP